MNKPHRDERSPASIQPGPTTVSPSGTPSEASEPEKDGAERRPDGLPQRNVNVASDKPSSSPEMPHERDETAGMTDGNPDARVEQAFDDLKKGRQDTSRGTESDAAYQRQKRD